MALATEVKLPRSHRARFPDRCVVCGAASPNSTMRLKTRISSWWSWLPWYCGESVAVSVPACDHCRRHLRVQQFLDILLLFVIGGGAVWLAWPYVGGLRHRRQKYVLFGIALAATMPLLIWRAFHPYPIALSANTKGLTYEFRDKGAACEFAELNQDAEWVKIG
jgi:hypothetical protein